jgi:hypothetical protein
MMAFDDIQAGTVIQLDADEDKAAIANLKILKRGLYRVKAVRPGYFSRTGKREHDTVAEVVKISQAGKPIGKYVWHYAVSYFMQHGVKVSDKMSLAKES